MPHAFDAGDDDVTQAITKVATTDDRPDPPEVTGDCQFRGCTVDADVNCWADHPEVEMYLQFCADHARQQAENHGDLEVID